MRPRPPRRPAGRTRRGAGGRGRGAADRFRIGCAGWAIPRGLADRFPGSGTHLERYARVLPATEVDSTFYRPHRPATWERWGASVPPGFRFAVKLHREFTHLRRLRDSSGLRDFLEGPARLGPKLGPLLVQLPPSLAFEAAVADRFFEGLRGAFEGAVALEPRHPSWAAPEAEALLRAHRIARVAADPPPARGLEGPAGFPDLVYHRLHGAPRRYRSPYSEDFLRELAASLLALPTGTHAWCIFDNTAEGAAPANALALLALLRGSEGPRSSGCRRG